jgi:hypothetical protein
MKTYYDQHHDAERRFQQDELEDIRQSKNKLDFEIKAVDLQKELDTLWGMNSSEEVTAK